MAAPDAPSAGQSNVSCRIDEDVRNIMVDAKVPYDIVCRFAQLGYSSLADFVELYDDKPSLKSGAPAELEFGPGKNGYDERSSKRAGIRLAQAWETSEITLKARKEAMTAQGAAQLKIIVSKPVRVNMEKMWANCHDNIKPPLDAQGSDTLLGLLTKELSSGWVPVLRESQLVSKLDESLGRTTKPARGEGNSSKEVEEEVGIPSSAVEGFEEKVRIHLVSYIMVVKTLPHIPQVQLTEARFQKFVSFFFGPRTSGTTAPVNLHLL